MWAMPTADLRAPIKLRVRQRDVCKDLLGGTSLDVPARIARLREG